MFKKKQTKSYVEMKGMLGNGADYHIYHMNAIDYIIAWCVGFASAALVLHVFFRYVIVSLLGGIVCAKLMPKYYREFRKKRRIKELRTQFKDMLESLTSSYSAGQNTMDAFESAREDMMSVYGTEADIVNETQIICTGLKNNLNIEALLLDFAERSGLEDVMSFANVFEVCNRQGGDLKRIVAETREILNDKIEVEMEIDTMLAGSKNEFYIMMVMPIIIVVMLKGLGTGTIGDNTAANFIVKLICIGIFALAYAMGKKIIDIKV